MQCLLDAPQTFQRGGPRQQYLIEKQDRGPGAVSLKQTSTRVSGLLIWGVRGSHLLVIPSMFELTKRAGAAVRAEVRVPIVQALGGLGDTVAGRDYGRDPPERSTGYVIHDVAHWARAIELWHRYPEDVRYLMHHGMRVDRLCGRAPALAGQGACVQNGFLEVVIAYDDDLSVAELGDVGRYPSSSVHRRERVCVLAVEDQVPVLACSRSCIDPVRKQFGQKGGCPQFSRSATARCRKAGGRPPRGGSVCQCET